jgi:hypothetical protein
MNISGNTILIFAGVISVRVIAFLQIFKFYHVTF